jgi:hypothetical protein
VLYMLENIRSTLKSARRTIKKWLNIKTHQQVPKLTKLIAITLFTPIFIFITILFFVGYGVILGIGIGIFLIKILILIFKTMKYTIKEI